MGGGCSLVPVGATLNRHLLDGLLLLPHDEWWVAWWWADVDPLCTVDVVTPVRHDGDVWVYEDLEIDLAMRESDGLVNVIDLDEFAMAALAAPYPAEVIVGAIGGMRSAERRMVDRHPPFDIGFSRLREVLGVADRFTGHRLFWIDALQRPRRFGVR